MTTESPSSKFKLYQPNAAEQKLNILIYGNQGVGKTALAATAQDHPQMRNVLFMNIEGGLLTISGVPGISAVDIRKTKEVEDLFWELDRATKGQESELTGYNTVVFDSGTEMQTVGLQNLADAAALKNPTKRDRDDIYLEDYGTSTAQLSRIFRWFRDLPIHFIITALPQEVRASRSAEAATIAIRPAFTERLASRVMGYMDFVWYLYVVDEQVPDPKDSAKTITVQRRSMLTRDQGLFRAKTRGIHFAEKLGGRVDNPSLPALFDLLIKTEGAQTTPAAISTTTSKETK